MLLTLLPMVMGTTVVPQGLGQLARLPASSSIRMGTPERWTIRAVPLAKRPDVRDGARESLTVRVAGKTVTIGANREYDLVDGVERGSDGSLLVHRAYRQIRWENQDFIWYRGRETRVPYGNVSIYRDRLNYAGSLIKNTSAIGMPESAPEGYVVEKGRHRPFGFGSVVDWRGDSFVLSVPVDDKGNPSGTEFTVGVVARVVDGARSQVFPDYVFLGREQDGTVLLTSGSGGTQEGFVPLNRKSPPAAAVLRVKGEKILDHWSLPTGWRVTGLAKGGWILVRRSPVSEEEAKLEIRPGMAVEEVNKATDRALEAGKKNLYRIERDWTAGILAHGYITPIEFPRPPRTAHLLWRDGAEVLGVDAFRLTAFLGDEEKTFRIAAPRHSVVHAKPQR